MNDKLLQIIVCGNGALAKAILDYEKQAGSKVQIIKFGLAVVLPREIAGAIGIHAGSGSQLPEFITYCEQFKIPLIQASTGIKLPEDFRIPIIEAPNLAIPIIAFLKHLPAFIDGITKGIGLEVTDVSLVESHQSTKKTVPGTAKKIAAAAGLPENQIFSVRDRNIQKLIPVPAANLDRHAYHLLEVIFGENLRIGVHTKVHGLEPYAAGGVILAKRAIECGIITQPPRLYQMTEFI